MKMLPFSVRLIAAAILHKQNHLLIAEVAYLRAEIAYLRDQLPKDRPLRFTDRWRKRLARAAAGVGWKRLAEIATVAKAGTIRNWHRLMLKGKLGISKAGPGKPSTSDEVQQVVIRMATENPTWGHHCIQGELAKLGIKLSPRTIAVILDRHGLKPAPERGTDSTWKTFISEHMNELAATDFFTVDVWSLLGKTSYDVLFAIHLHTRRVHIVGITAHAVEAFMVQTARILTMAETGWLTQVGARYLIHDRDAKFCAAWKDALATGGVETVAIPPRSPNLNAFAERWVRTVKRECIRRCWCIGRGGLERALNRYLLHYHEQRPHQGKGNRLLTDFAQAEPPPQISIADFRASQVRCTIANNGTIRHYALAA
jgi:putative transposase